jgi:hypothetical protein
VHPFDLDDDVAIEVRASVEASSTGLVDPLVVVLERGLARAARRGPRRWFAEVFEDAVDSRGCGDGGDDARARVTLRAGEDIRSERSAEQRRPIETRRRRDETAFVEPGEVRGDEGAGHVSNLARGARS